MQTHRESPSVSANGYGQKLDPFGRPLASWGARLGALMLDGILVAVCFIGLVVLVAIVGTLPLALPYLLGVFLVLLLYHSLLNGGAGGQTVGKKVAHIQVRSVASGGPLGTGKGFLRTFISSIPATRTALIVSGR
jgi:uncharacterized RDD family membrane protein YckC